MISAQTIWKRIFSSAVLCGLILSVGQPTLRADAHPQTQTGPKPIVIYPVRFGMSRTLSEAPDQTRQPSPENQGTLDAPTGGPLMPPLTDNWAGLSNEDNFQFNGRYTNPPDVNGDIGPDHYIQVVNNVFEILNRFGARLHGPAPINTLFANLGGMCASHNDGEPIVLYDHLADRWLLSQVAKDDVDPGFEYHQCVAISSSPNPDPVNSPWYLYDFQILNTSADMYAAPKIGVWTNGYYMSVDQLHYNGATFDPAGQGVAVLDRAEMLTGQNARMVYFDLNNSNPDLSMMLPADLDGPPPPAGTPGYFVQIDDDATAASPVDQLQIWSLDASWATNTWAFGGNQNLTVPAFSALCINNLDCIPQPGATVSQYLDAKSERLMYRLQYRYQGGTGHMVVNHTVDSGSARAGIRWYNLQVNTSTLKWEILDNGTYAPGTDSDHRWMGSAAMDASGNIAIGYSVSSSATYPSIRYAGRLAGDPAGQLSQGEGTIATGTGIQQDPASRWGNFSMMTVDPTDQCTFWYTGEYMGPTNANPLITNWQTKIAKFSFIGTGCTTPLIYSISGAVTDQALVPIANASVTTDTGYYAQTGPTGLYTLNGLPNGAVTVMVNASGYSPASQPVNVSGGDVVDVNFALTSANKDDFDGALAISGIPFLHTTNTTTATSAPDDPDIPGCISNKGSATVWFKYTSPSPQSVYIDTYGSDYNTFIAVWRGSRGSLTPVICNDNVGTSLQSALTLPADNNTYYIEVGQSGAASPAGGNLQFHLVSFADVPGDYWSWRYIETLYKAGITGGCSLSPKMYCPGTTVTRDQMAVFLLRAKHGASYVPPPATGIFVDVPLNFWAASWIEQLAAEGITGGCSITPKMYCPSTPVSRDQMAVFLLRVKHGVAYTPPNPTGIFADVPPSFWAASWIEQLAAEGVTGGCSVTPKMYCPSTPVSRDQMAVFLVRTASLPLIP